MNAPADRTPDSPDDAMPPARPAFRTILFFIFKIVLLLGIIGYLYAHDKIPDFSQIDTLPLWVYPLFFFMLYEPMILAAKRWQVLLKIHDIKMPLYTAISLYAQSVFYSLALPGGAVGGDTVKIGMVCAYMKKGSRLDAAATIFIDRLLGMISLFAGTLLLMPIAVLYWTECSLISRWIILCTAGICLAGLTCGFLLFCHRFLEKLPFIAPLIAWANGKTHELPARLFAMLDRYRENYKILVYWSILGIFIIHLPAAVALMAVLWGLGIDAVPLFPLILTGFIGNIAAILPLSVGGFGIREFVFVTLFMSFGGLSEARSMEVMFLIAAGMLLYSLSCGLMTLLPAGMQKIKKDA